MLRLHSGERVLAEQCGGEDHALGSQTAKKWLHTCGMEHVTSPQHLKMERVTMMTPQNSLEY